MISLTDSSAIFHYHRQMIAWHGHDSSFALGWRNTESQQIRFKALATIGDLNGYSVLDAGCGYADLLPYLTNLYPNIGSYRGVEYIPELLAVAIERYGIIPNIMLIPGNFLSKELPMADYVLASGSLNYGSTEPDFIFKAIDKLYAGCNIGFGFNLLRKVSAGILVAYDPNEIISYCKNICPNVVLKDDYAEEDFTVFMYC